MQERTSSSKYIRFFYLFRRNKRNKRSQRTTLRHQLNLLWGINNWMYIRAICAVPRRRHPCNNISHEADCTFFDFVSTMYYIRRRLQMFLLVPPFTFPVARSMIQWFNSIGWYSIWICDVLSLPFCPVCSTFCPGIENTAVDYQTGQ